MSSYNEPLKSNRLRRRFCLRNPLRLGPIHKEGSVMADQSVIDETRRLRFSGSSLIDALGNFLRALDVVHLTWLQSDGSLSEPLARLSHARNNVNEFVDSRIVSPVGQTGIQFAANLLNLVEEAWHLCRFVNSFRSDDSFTKPEDTRLLTQMISRPPAIHDELRSAWLHLKHVALLEARNVDADFESGETTTRSVMLGGKTPPPQAQAHRPPVNEPPNELLDALTPHQVKLLKFLWTQPHGVSWDSLPRDAFRAEDNRQDATVKRALPV